MNDDNQERGRVVARTIEDATVRQLALPPLPPAQFKAEQYMNGVRVTCEGRDRVLERDGAVAYRIRWAASVDTSTQTGKDQGYARSVIVDSLAVPGLAKLSVERLITDSKFSSGYFFAEGIDSRGNASPEYIVAGPISNQILDATVPADPTHVQISGSGEFVGGDVIEALSVSLRTPLPLGSFDGVQLFLQDYINLGTMQEGEFHRGNGVAASSIQFKSPYQLARRIGTGTSITVTNTSTAVTGVGTKFTTQCKTGDMLEVGMHRVAVGSVTDDTHLTLASNWLWLTLTTADFSFYAKVRVYVVSISKGGTHRGDVTNAPFVDVVFNGSLGTPNAPTITATVIGNAIRVEFPIIVGTQIKGYRLYRGTGTSVTFALCTAIDELAQPKSDVAIASSNLQFEDSSFSPFQKEQAQVFTYYVTTVNERGDESLASNGQNATCRLDSPDDTENGGRVGLKNLLYNAMLAGFAAQTVTNATNATPIVVTTSANHGFATGQVVVIAGVTGNTAANGQWTITKITNTTFSLDTSAGNGAYVSGGTVEATVTDNDTAQDANLFTFVDGGYTPGHAGTPYGGNAGQADGTNRYKGYTRWAGTKTTGAASRPTYVNGNEVRMPAPTGGNSSFLFQEIGAWDDGPVRGAQFAKMKKNGFIVFQVKMRIDAGNVPNGGLRLVVEQYSNNTLTGNAKRQYRDTSSVLQFATGTNSNFDVAGSLLTSTWQTFWAVYQFDGALGTTKQMRFTLEHHDTSNGFPIYVSDPMVNDGTDRGAWTADMADPYISLPIPSNPPPEPDRDGRRRWDKIA